MREPHPRVVARSTTALLGAVLLAAIATPGAVGQDETVIITSTLEPASLEVAPGASVTWRNDDAERHRIRSREGPEEFDSGDLEPGERFTFTFALEGTYPYLDERDDEDPAYFGTIVVTASPGERSAPDELATSGTVTIGDRVFIPPTIEVATGSTVEFTNADGESHTATASDGSFDSGILAPGGTFLQTFGQAGSFPFFCAIHPDMQGTITVADPVAGASPALEAPPGTPTAPIAPSPSGALGASPPAVAGTAVRIADRSFDPASAAVTLGTTIEWTNDDVDGHTVTAQDRSFDSGIIPPGATFSQTFEMPGTFDYFCAIHPEMLGTVVVTAPADPGASPAPSLPMAGG